jgi:hypothetical protein
MGHLASAVFFAHDPKRCYLAVFNCYFDASGQETLPDQKAVVAVGTVATLEQWIGFEREWQRILDKYHVRSFHASKFEPKRTPFGDSKTYEPKRKDAFIAELTATLWAHLARVVITGVDLTVYSRITSRFALATGTEGAYAVSMLDCLCTVEAWLSEQYRDAHWEHFVEKGDPGQSLFEELTKKLDIDPGLISKNDPKLGIARLPFQASDLVAYHYRQHFAEVIARGEQIPFGTRMQKLDSPLFYERIKPYEALEAMCIAMETPLRNQTP